jgi:hypothetical protein
MYTQSLQRPNALPLAPAKANHSKTPTASTALRFGAAGCPYCLAGLALMAITNEMSEIRGREAAFAPTPSSEFEQSSSGVQGNRLDVVPTIEEANVLFSTQKRTFVPGAGIFRFKPDEPLQHVVSEGIFNARKQHNPTKTPKTYQSYELGKPLPVGQLPAKLAEPQTFSVVHHMAHEKSLGRTKPSPLGYVTLTQKEPDELLQVSTREYPVARSWDANAASTTLILAQAAKDPRFKTLAVVVDAYRHDLTPPDQPDLLRMMGHLKKNGIEVKEYATPRAGKLPGQQTVDVLSLPKAYRDTLKQLYPHNEARVFQVPLQPFQGDMSDDARLKAIWDKASH